MLLIKCYCNPLLEKTLYIIFEIYKMYVGFGSQLFHNYCENPRFNAEIVK